MSTVTYEIVPHDGGWAYRVGDVYSETFPTKEHATTAAQQAATEQEKTGPTEEIEFQDEDGVWHEEIAAGVDRPRTEVDEP